MSAREHLIGDSTVTHHKAWRARNQEPATLMSSLPENLGVGLEDALPAGKARLNFTQFFLLLINIASIVHEVSQRLLRNGCYF